MKEKKYYRRLDYIRIIACIMVLLYHLNIVKGGFLTVCTFFVLTGYLDCMNALKQEKFSIKDYYLKRIKRIYLPLLVVLSITVIVFKLVNYVNWLNLKPEVISAVFGYNNFWQLQANLNYFTKNVSSPLIHIWYISILMQFDLVFPLIFVLFKKISKKIKNFSLVLVSLLTIASTGLFIYMSKTQSIMTVYYNTFARSFSILWGVLIALINYRFTIKGFKKNSLFIFSLYSVILLTLCFLISDKSSYYALFMIITTLLSCRLIEYALLKESQLEKSKDFIANFSKATYEIYLVQYPIIFFIQNLELDNTIKLLVIILSTIILGLIIHNLVNFKVKSKLIKALKVIVLSLIIVVGTVVVILEKDNTEEMKRLENKLNDNLKIMEQKNKEYMNSEISEEEKWDKLLEDLDAEEDKVVSKQVRELRVVGVGDSVFLDAVGGLYEKFPNGYFDGKVSRSILGGIDVLKKLKAEGKLSNTIVLALATNSDFVESWNNTVMDILGDREIYWINAIGADDPTFNSKFVKYAQKRKNIHIVDWEGAAKGQKDLFYVDGIHPNEKGIKVYVDTIYKTIYDDYLAKYRIKRKELLAKKAKEEQEKITFYGNNALINSFEELQNKFKKASFNAKADYQYKSISNEISNKIKEKKLEHKIVFVFDNEANLTDSDYEQLIDLCKDHEIYIVSINKPIRINNKNIKLINFYNELKRHDEYFIADKVHLSEKGNIELAKLISESIK